MPSSKVSISKTKSSNKKVVTKSKPVLTSSVAPPKTAVTATTKSNSTSGAVTTTVTNTTGSQFTERIQSLQTTVVALSSQLRGLSKELTTIQKEYAKEKRQWERQALVAQKKKKSSGSTTVSGIAKPGYISPELCKFIGKDPGTEMARTEVIKHVNTYIKNNGLQDAKNKRIIRPDSKLQTLLKTKKSDEVTYFNLQTFMKPHYANPAKQTSISA